MCGRPLDQGTEMGESPFDTSTIGLGVGIESEAVIGGVRRRVELRHGAFACTVEGFDDPVSVLRDVIGFVQRAHEETPELAGTAITFDNETLQNLLDEILARGDTGHVDVVPSLSVRRHAGQSSYAEEGGSAQPLARVSDPVDGHVLYANGAGDYGGPEGFSAKPDNGDVSERWADEDVIEPLSTEPWLDSTETAHNPDGIAERETEGDDYRGYADNSDEEYRSEHHDAEARPLRAVEPDDDALAAEASDRFGGFAGGPEADAVGARTGHEFFETGDGPGSDHAPEPPTSTDGPDDQHPTNIFAAPAISEESSAEDTAPEPHHVELADGGYVHDEHDDQAPQGGNALTRALRRSSAPAPIEAVPDDPPAALPAKVNIFSRPTEVVAYGDEPTFEPVENTDYGGYDEEDNEARDDFGADDTLRGGADFEGTEASAAGRDAEWEDDEDEDPVPDDESQFDQLLKRLHDRETSTEIYRPASDDVDPDDGIGDDDDEESPLDQVSVEELAKRAGAVKVPELLLTAAAWLTIVRGSTAFTRRDVMDVFDEIPGDHDTSLEARIKGFGRLVRNGSVQPVADGQFIVAQNEREEFTQLFYQA